MARVRVYEIAGEYGVESKAVIAIIEELGEFVRSASSTVDPDLEERIRAELGQKGIGVNQPPLPSDKGSAWRSLSQRGNDDGDAETLYEGVPSHLRGPLLHWLKCRLSGGATYASGFDVASDGMALRIANRLRINLENTGASGSRSSGSQRTGLRFAESLISIAQDSDGVQLLDIIDAALADRHGRRRGDIPNRPADLDVLLVEGGSAYYVNDDGTALERRVDNTVKSAVRRATDRSTEPGRHLESAWQAVYGIKPDPTAAYAEAVKAVEAALIPLVLPDDRQATLGKAIRTLRGTAGRWELAISNRQAVPAEIGPLIDLVALVWDGHRDRHAGTPTAITTKPEAAEMAVHAAAMIVHWIGRNGLRRR